MTTPLRVIDSHCHLELADFGPTETERAAVMDRARAAGVCHFVTVGSGRSLAEVENALALAAAHDDVSAAVAIHPHDARLLDEPTFARIEAAVLAREDVVAVGETGLDYHYDHSPREVQQAVFRRFIDLAKRARKPLTLHIRDGKGPGDAAHVDARRLFVEEGARDLSPIPAVVHCFTGTVEDARAWLDLGCALSFSGILTFKSAEELRRAAAFAPADRILVETDCPYLAPLPYRGRKNEPAWVVETLRCLADVRKVPLAEAAAATVAATVAAFRLPRRLDAA